MPIEDADANGVGFTDDYQVTINRADEVMVSPTGEEKWYSISPGDLWALLHEEYLHGRLIPTHYFNTGTTECTHLSFPNEKHS